MGQLMNGGSGSEDPLDSEEQLQDQMESLPYMCRLQYPRSAEFLIRLLDPLIAALQERMQTGRKLFAHLGERLGERGACDFDVPDLEQHVLRLMGICSGCMLV